MKSESITIRYRDRQGVIRLIIPNFFDHAPLGNLEKIFKLLFRNLQESENQDTIDMLEWFFPEAIEEKWQQWAKESADFQREYRDPTFVYNKKEKAAIKAQNNKMLKRVKAARRAYEKICEVTTRYLIIKAKYVKPI